MYHIKEFLSYLQSIGTAKSTIYGYSLVLKAFTQYLKEHGVDDIREANEKTVVEYLNLMTDYEPVIIVSKRQKIAKIIKYLNYLVESNRIFLSPLKDYVPPRRIKFSYPILNQKDLLEMMNSII